MERLRIHIFLLLALILPFLGSASGASAQTAEAPTGRFSLLTCSSGQEVWNRFGHTALRYEDPSRDIDWVYNYGVFSFSAPNFILRFMLGQTDYMLQKETWQSFRYGYMLQGRGVTALYLDLDESQSQRLLQLLETNARKENCTYRYNFFFDNCSTRVRDKILEVVPNLEMTLDVEGKSFRSVINAYLKDNPWYRTGISLLVGKRADEALTSQEAMFAPELLEEAVLRSTVLAPDGQRPLITEAARLLEPEKQQEGFSLAGLFTPFRLVLILLAAICLLSVRDIRKGQMSLWADVLLFSVMGLAGCIILFMVLLSEHPAMSPNYCLLVLSPLYLILLPLVVREGRKPSWPHGLLTASLPCLLALLTWALMKQKMPAMLLPLSLIPLLRALTQAAIAGKVSVLQQKGKKESAGAANKNHKNKKRP